MKRLINNPMPRTKNSAHGITGEIGLVVLLMLCSQGCGISGSVEEDPTETGQATVTESVTAGDSSRRELADVNCQAGQYPRWSSTLSNWICSTPEQSLEQILDCKVDQIPTFIGQAWACQDDQTIPNTDVLANITNCEKGFTPKWIQGAWLCQPDQWDPDTTIANVDTLRSLSCKEAEKDLLEKTKEGWSCTTDQNSDAIAKTDIITAISCTTSDFILLWNDTDKRWECNKAQDTDTKMTPSCLANQSLVRKGTSWECKELSRQRASIQAIALGDAHGCAILPDGSLKCWGNNSKGQLGQGDTNHRGDEAKELGVHLPQINLGTGRTALSIAPGGAHTCALLDDGSVKCWGDNNSGQLGIQDTSGLKIQMGDGTNEMGDLSAVELGATAIRVASGGSHSCAILNNGSVKCWGLNDRGQLGIKSTTNQNGSALAAVDLGAGRTAASLHWDRKAAAPYSTTKK